MGPKEELPRRVVMPCLVRVASVVAGEPVLVLLTRIPVAAAGLLVVQPGRLLPHAKIQPDATDLASRGLARVSTPSLPRNIRHRILYDMSSYR